MRDRLVRSACPARLIDDASQAISIINSRSHIITRVSADGLLTDRGPEHFGNKKGFAEFGMGKGEDWSMRLRFVEFTLGMA